MTNNDIRSALEVIFSSARSPGQAFDEIIKMRKADVGYPEIRKAILETTDDLSKIESDAVVEDPLFFGKYRGQALAKVAARDPAYLHWALENATCLNDQWKAKIERALEEQGSEDDDDDEPDNDCKSLEL